MKFNLNLKNFLTSILSGLLIMSVISPAFAKDRADASAVGDRCHETFELYFGKVSEGNLGGLAAMATAVAYFGMKLPGMPMDLAGISHPTTVLALNALARGAPDEMTGVSLIAAVYRYGSAAVLRELDDCKAIGSEGWPNICASTIIKRGYVEHSEVFIARLNEYVRAGKSAVCLDRDNVFRAPRE